MDKMEQRDELATPVEPLIMSGEELRKALNIPADAAVAVIPAVDFKHDPDAPAIDPATDVQAMAKRIQEAGPESVGTQTRFAIWKLRMKTFLESPDSRKVENCVQFLRDSGWAAIEIADSVSPTNP